jgi:predicted nucleic-acid-binding protein
MIGIDTNILLRYLLDDDAAQSKAAVALIDDTCSAHNPAVVSDVVIAEAAWFMTRRLKLDRLQLTGIVFDLLDNQNLKFVSADAAQAAAVAHRDGKGDFADYFIGALNHKFGTVTTMTFDRAATDHQFMTLLSTKG